MPPTDHGPPPRRVVLGLTTGQFIATMSTTMIATSLPTILGELGGQSQLPWIASTTLLAATVAGPSLGKLSDTWGRRPVFVTIIAVYIVGAAAAATAHSNWQLVLGLAALGVGIGGMLVMTQVLLSDMTTPRERGRYIGYVVMGYAGGSLSGPVIGGLLAGVPWLGWRLCFLTVIAVAVLVTWLVAAGVSTARPDPADRLPVDVMGMAWLALTTVCVLVLVNFAGRRLEWTDAPVWVVLVVGFLAALALVRVERRAPSPLLDHAVLWSPVVRRCLALSVITSGLMYTTLFLLPQYLQIARDLSPTASAFYLLPILLAQIVLTPIVGRLVSRRGDWRHLAIGGMTSLTTGVAIMGLSRDSPETITLTAGMLLVGVGLACTVQIIMSLAQTQTPAGHTGAVTSFVTFCRSLGSSIGVAALGSISSTRAHSLVPERLADAGLTMSRARELAAGPGLAGQHHRASRHAAPRSDGLVRDGFAGCLPGRQHRRGGGTHPHDRSQGAISARHPPHHERAVTRP